MKFLAKIDPRTQVHALWRLQDRKKALTLLDEDMIRLDGIIKAFNRFI